MNELKNEEEILTDKLSQELETVRQDLNNQKKDLEQEITKLTETLALEASSLESGKAKLTEISSEIEKVRGLVIIRDEELLSLESTLKENKRSLQGFEEENGKAEEVVIVSRTRTEELVAQLENIEGAVNALKEQFVNIKLDKEKNAFLLLDEDELYVTEREKYENLSLDLECLKLSRTESEKAIKDGVEKLEDVQSKIMELKRSREELSQGFSDEYSKLHQVFFSLLFTDGGKILSYIKAVFMFWNVRFVYNLGGFPIIYI